MQEVKEEQARRKAEGKTAMYKSLKKRRSRKHGCSSGKGITAEEDKKRDKNNEVGCSSGTDIAPEEDKKKDKNNEVGCSSGTDIAAGEEKKRAENNEFGCPSGTDIAPGEDKKKDKNNEVGCPKGTNIAAEEDKKKDKNNEVGCSSGTDIAAGEEKKRAENNEFGCPSGTDIAPGEDKKKDKNNEVGCPKGTNIATEEDKKSNEQQGGIFPSNRPQMDPSSSSNTKVRSGKFRRQASPHHAPHNPVPPETHPSVSQGLLSESEEKKGVQSKRKLCKTVRFQIDGQPEVLHPGVDDEEAQDSLSVLRDENSCKLCFVFQPPMLKEQGLKFVFFFLLDLICFQQTV